MKTLYIAVFVFLFLSQSAFSKTYYVTPTGQSGNSGNSFSSPKDFKSALTLVVAGDTILLQGGKYTIPHTGSVNSILFTKSGQANNPICVVAYNNSRAIFDFSFPEQAWVQDSYGFHITGSYWYFKGIYITRAGYQGAFVKGSHNTFENCAFYDNRNTGLEINEGGAYTTVINCDAYRNYDPKKSGSMADGFGPKQLQGPGNKFIGCRAWENSDDGYDCFDSPEIVTFENCWAMRNGVDVWQYGGFTGNGNGFKVGGNFKVANIKLTNCIAIGHPKKGFDQNNNAGGLTIYHCLGYLNTANYGLGGALNSGQKHDLRNNISLGTTTNTIANANQSNNSWNSGFSVSTSNFISLDTSLADIARNPDGSIPYTDLFRVKLSSTNLIDKGINVGLPYNGSAPDLGPFETGTPVVNQPPTVSITLPSNNATFTAPASITINAIAADADGTVNNVQFYNGATLLGSDASSPYSYSWTNVAAGTYTISARANDDDGAVTTSSAITVVVNGIPDLCQPVGWATQNGGTTGGGNVSPTIVNNYNDLKTAITSASVKVVQIEGTIEIPSGGRIIFQDQSGKTIYGMPGAKLISNDLTKEGSGIFVVKRCTNVIFRNILFEGPGAYDVNGSDNMVLEESSNIWIDHCEFRDGIDGNLDIKNASDFISITWCKFSYNKPFIPGGIGGIDDHRFSNLFGSSDDAVGDRGKLNITLQHCWWAEGCVERMPWVRFGKAHVVNNYFNSTASVSCVRAGFEANILVEKNVFENVNDPIFLVSNKWTAVGVVDNIFTNTTGNKAGGGTVFTPPYSLTKTPVSEVKSQVVAGAGATLSMPTCGGSNQFPAVSITSPVNNATFTAPASITIDATAADADGTITSVAFYNGTTLLGTDASAPYSYSWTNAAAGTYTITAKATDNNGAVTTSSAITIIVNGVPGTDVTIQAETGCSIDGVMLETDQPGYNGTGFVNTNNALGAAVTWSINSPSSQTINLAIKFANGGTANRDMSLSVNGTVQVATVSFPSTGSFATWTTGNVSITLARGTNKITMTSLTSAGGPNIDELTYNSPNISTGSCSQVPTVNITLPASGAVFTAPASVTINADAADADGAITKVDFYNGTTFLGTDASSPYSFTWTSVAAGTYSLTAVATDNDGAVTTSSAISITVNGPVNQSPDVSITAPANNHTVCAGTAIALTASASDPDGTISKVEFYNGAALLGTATTTPYTFNWTNAGAGTHSITAKATDNQSAMTTSAAVSITVNAIPSSPTVTTPVTYCQNVTATALAATGIGLKWYTVSSGGASSSTAPIPSTAIAGTTNYYVSQTVNGCESARATITVTVNANPPATVTANGPTTFTQGGSVLLSANTGTDLTYRWLNGPAEVGTNSTYTATRAGNYTVEVSNSFGCKATSAVTQVTVNGNEIPSVNITAPANNASFMEQASMIIEATASDVDGTVSKVDFYNGTTFIGTDNSSPYSFPWANVMAGTYYITALATDNLGATATSGVITVIVTVNQAPTITITSPANNASFIAPANVTITATADDADGTVTQVDFYHGSALLGTALSFPYSFAFNNLLAGTYTLTAVATDNLGGITTSAAISITVNPNQLSLIDIVSPLNNSIVSGAVTIDVNATDPDGSITLVEYLDGTTVIGSSTAQPFTFTWNNAPDGSHTITVRVTDSHGGVTTSSPVTFIVDTTTGITSDSFSAFSKVYPNPALETFTIKASLSITDLAVFNIYGTEIISLQNIPADQKVEIGREFTEGTYVLVIKYVSDRMEVMKLVKIK